MLSGNIFNNLNQYDGELGAIYSKDKTEFIIWAPTANKVELKLYESTNKPISMIKEEKGIWKTVVLGDLNGVYYNYLVDVDGKVNEVVDPYAKAVGVNGLKSMVIDLESTNPEGWEEDKKPDLNRIIDSILYEAHIRDFSIDESSGVSKKNRGKYNGMWEENTTIPGTNIKTCIDHLKELGITTLHLLPTFDYCTVDESKPEVPQYNWGYDPQNFNVPEGSYSLDPFNGEVRIKEFKEMILHLHKAGIRVVMDMVYNHTFASYDSNLNKAVPNYYYRQDSNGNFSNGSGCGCELASERPMVRKLITDSVVYWAKEYHIDGFRFDLMGLTDIQTMKELRFRLNKIDKTIILYGEGWQGGASPLPEREAALKYNTVKYGSSQIAVFNDNTRDGIKGHVFNAKERGFVNDQPGYEETIKFGVVAATYHSDINYSMVANSKDPWANEPYQTVNYDSAHDNFTLWDKLQVSTEGKSEEELIQMNKLAAAIVFTSQGIPFIQAGEELARTKVNPDGTLNENSYNSPDSVNRIDWNRKIKYKELFDYYKGLIKLRKNHKAFRMDFNSEIQDNLKFLNPGISNVVAYSINGGAVKDKYNEIIVICNANNFNIKIDLPNKEYVIIVNEKSAGTEKLDEIKEGSIEVKSKSCYVLVDSNSYNNWNS
ncbi:MAG: type I pullulanase [Clostridiales bacterium]|nr:type I pullulanase [Clostridiales bacterium]